MKEERRGTQSRKADTTLNCASETKAVLKRYSQSKKVSMNIILDHVIPRVVEYDIYDSDWADKLRIATERINAASDEGCSHLHLIEGKYACVWRNYEGPPKMRVLSKTREGADEACLGCKEGKDTTALRSNLRDLNEKFDLLWDTYHELEEVAANAMWELQEIRGENDEDETDEVVHPAPSVS